MLTFYYNPLSPNARRVWLTLLEKDLPFEPVVLKLNGDQYQPDYLAINPFHHIPTLVDGDVKLMESLAILDYLDAKYSEPCLLPKSPGLLAQVRMVQLLTANELLPNVLPLIYADESSPQVQNSRQQLAVTLKFLSELLGDTPWFGGDRLSLADIVVGTVIPLLRRLDYDLSTFGGLVDWCDRITARPAWQQTQLSSEGWVEFQRRIQLMAKRRYKTFHQTTLKPITQKPKRGAS